MANLPLAFAELLMGAILVDAGVKGDSIANVVRGAASMHPVGGGSNPLTQLTGGGGPPSNPLPGAVKWGRTDQGVDASATPGTPVRAIAGGVVSKIDPNWYQGQPAVYVSSPGLPGGADAIYYAEQLLPNVHVGQSVQAGQQIGTVAPAGTGLEFGLAKGGQTLAQATTGYAEGAATGAGNLFRSFLASIGVKGL